MTELTDKDLKRTDRSTLRDLKENMNIIREIKDIKENQMK